jgi:hypothetical protein
VLEVDDLTRRAQADLAREERPAVLRRSTRDRGIAATASALASSAAASAAATTASALKPAATDAPELEDIGVLQEEVALLGKEQTETREVDLAIVDLRRREVRVDRQGGVQRRRDLVEEIERGLRVGRRLARRIELAVAQRYRRHDVGPAPCSRPSKPIALPATLGFI